MEVEKKVREKRIVTKKLKDGTAKWGNGIIRVPKPRFKGGM